MTLKNGLIAGVIVILAVFAGIGWTRARNAQAVNTPVTYSQPANYNAAPGNSAAYVAGAPNYAGGQASTYSPEQPEPYESVIPEPVVVQAAPVPEPPAAYVPGPGPAVVAGGPPPPPAPIYYERRHHHHRSLKKSVAIVAGSAGVGAAVGALAGGGKGAGIGALAGGAGGFIYDRLTHNH